MKIKINKNIKNKVKEGENTINTRVHKKINMGLSQNKNK